MEPQNEALRIRKLSQQYAFTSIQLHETVGRKIGLTGTDHKYLGFIIQKGQMTAGELAVLTGLTTGAVTGLIDRFVKKKLVKRQFDKTDRRKIIIVPHTDKIMALFEPMYKDFQDHSDELMASFSNEELKTLETYFLKALTIMNNKIVKLNQTPKKMTDNHTDASPTPLHSEQGSTTYYHGTKADLNVGDLIATGFSSNYGKKKKAKYIYLTATLEAAIWGAELAFGEGRERIYIVEPTGPIEDDPNLTDQKFPGNPTKSYRSLHPFKVISEVPAWQGHTAEQLQKMKDRLRELDEQGIEAIE